MWKVETHKSLVGLHQSTVDVEVSGGTGQGLNVDAPLVRVQVEGLESTLLAKTLRHVDLLVTAIVSISIDVVRLCSLLFRHFSTVVILLAYLAPG